MRSRGTKATQGINGDAANLSRWMDAVGRSHAPTGEASHYEPAGLTAAQVGAACGYAHHRPQDWVTPESQVKCGVCHPPILEFDGIRRRGEDGFDELAEAAASRIVKVARCLTCNGALTAVEARAQSLYCAACAGPRRPDEVAELAIAEEELSLERRGMPAATTDELADEELELDQALDVALEADR